VAREEGNCFLSLKNKNRIGVFTRGKWNENKTVGYCSGCGAFGLRGTSQKHFFLALARSPEGKRSLHNRFGLLVRQEKGW
jgi:hypothetical protein